MLIDYTHLNTLQHAEAVKQLHHSMGHRSVKRLIKLKKHNKATATRLPSQMLREYEYICPICLASISDERHCQAPQKWNPKLNQVNGRKCRLILQALGQLKAHEAIAITKHLSILKMGKNNHTSCFKSMFLARGCNHIIVLTEEHHDI
jgi:hypothetical protein